MRRVPTRKALKPAARSFASSAAERMPDSLTAMQSSGICSISSNEVSTRTSSVLRLRLLTPIIFAPAAMARVSSSLV